MASRGKGRRRREALALRSSRDLLKRGKSGVAKQLPPPPQAKDGEQLVPRSLKRIMALRQGLQGGGQAAVGAGKKRGNKFKMAAEDASSAPPAGAAQSHTIEQPSSRSDVSGAQSSGEQLGSAHPGGAGAGPVGGNDARQKRTAAAGGSGGADHRASAAADASRGPGHKLSAAVNTSSQDHLSERQRARRERLKAKQQKQKARRKGGKPEAEDDDDALERRLLADRNKPKFGEQAMAPLQTSLKRKHWDEGANARHSALFERQMRQAAARLQPDEAVRDQVIEAYRQQKRAAGGKRGGAPPTATRASLTALMSKHEAAARGSV